MRLIIKTTLLFLALACIVFAVGGYYAYRTLQNEIQQETDWSLVHQFRDVRERLQKGEPLDMVQSRKISIEPVDMINPDTSISFGDTLAMHTNMNVMEQHRKLSVIRSVNGEFYRFELYDVIFEQEDIVDTVRKMIVRLFALLGITLIIGSFFISRWLLRPFEYTLGKIKGFDLKAEGELDLPSTNTREFQVLNNFIGDMTEKAREDYHSLREFSENASHEIQTPLAVAIGKLELLMESSNLSSEQLELIQSAESSLNKLSKMGKSLLLLAKIDNREFNPDEKVNFSELVSNNVNYLKDIAELRDIEINNGIDSDVSVRMNANLAEIMIMNILKNAIQHNMDHGKIEISLTPKSFKVRNTGPEPAGSPSQFFERFKKNNQSSNSVGLGLSIVQKICESHGFDISYDFRNKFHDLEVRF